MHLVRMGEDSTAVRVGMSGPGERDQLVERGVDGCTKFRRTFVVREWMATEDG